MDSQNDLVLDRLIHYKPKKKKNSTRCWCFIEREDLKPGPQVLELYAKPSDPGRKKKLKLCATLSFEFVNELACVLTMGARGWGRHTVKKLYLHVDVRM